MPETSDRDSGPHEVHLRDLRTGPVSVVVVARVLRCERREIVRRSDGTRRPVLSGLLSDGTASLRFTWWDPPNEPIEAGTVLRVARPELREFRGRVELSITWRSRVEPASPLELDPVPAAELPVVSVRQLSVGAEGFSLEARVARSATKTVVVRGESKTIQEGTLLDGTGTVPFTAWSEFPFSPGDAVRILGGVVREYRGRPQISIDERSHVERIAGEDLPTVTTFALPARATIAELERAGGAEVASVEGVVLSLSPGSGLVSRCPNCERLVRDRRCRIHGVVVGRADLLARIVLDDGTASATVQTPRPLTEALWGTTLDERLARTGSSPDAAAIEEELAECLFGSRLRAEGRATCDEFGVTVYPDRIERIHLRVEDRLRELESRVGGNAR